ncbi:MAG: DsbA family protein [Rhodanobacter sp.]
MAKVIHYLYDPLCGWCYGATPAVSVLLETPGVRIELLPTGLFSGMGARAMNNEFAAYAWSIDQRIEQLTAQPFSEAYRQKVLGDRHHHFNSGPATLALTAVALRAPSREFEALKAIQHARYVDGDDVTSRPKLVDLLNRLNLQTSATLLERADPELLDAARARTGRAQALMRELGARGVPTFIAESGTGRKLLDTRAVYARPHALVSQIHASEPA